MFNCKSVFKYNPHAILSHFTKMEARNKTFEEIINQLPIAIVQYSPFNAETLWERSKKGRKLSHDELWPTIPYIQDNLQAALTKPDICYLLLCGSECILEWTRTTWPQIPARLARKLETNGEHYRLMEWEMQIQKNMFLAYYYLLGENKICEAATQQDVMKYTPPAPTLDEGYTAEDHQKIQHYALETACKYLKLVPRTGPMEWWKLLDSEQSKMEHWRYMTYTKFSVKPKPVTVDR